MNNDLSQIISDVAMEMHNLCLKQRRQIIEQIKKHGNDDISLVMSTTIQAGEFEECVYTDSVLIGKLREVDVEI